ncbi:MAG: trypsin-like serine protease, partial [Labilithrix sp.]|nr:trypsin-like serine protease [Labilithrix sp.]
MRLLGAVCASILAGSLGALAACGGTPDAKEPTTAQAVSAASVSIALFDEHGTRVGEGSGVMIAPRLVLTSGHLISGKHRWVVTSADGKQQVTGSRGMTYDWRTYDSDKAHPRRRDVGVIHLDESIKLSAYPKLVAERSASGTKATRVRGSSGGFQQHDMTLERVRSSPNAWLADGQPEEALDTGGAVYDARGILGVVSGRGMTTGKLYVARVDGLVKWLAPKIACAGGATGVRTYAGPAVDKSQEICEDAGAGTSSGETASGGGGPGDDNGGSCDGNYDGVCSGDCSGADGSSGTNGASGPGGDGTPGGSSGAPGDGSDGNGGT